MTTVLNLSDHDGVQRVVRTGGIVAVPTDTVYGVGAWLGDPVAVRRLFSIKGRPETVALPVLVAGVDQITALDVTWTDRAAAVSSRFWPGALTIIVSVDDELARRVGGNVSIGFRVPGDDALRELLAVTGPMAVTSANRHGEPPCHTVDEVTAAFGPSALDAIIDGGRRDGVVSTVIDLTGAEWLVRRAGALSTEELAEVLGPPGDLAAAR